MTNTLSRRLLAYLKDPTPEALYSAARVLVDTDIGEAAVARRITVARAQLDAEIAERASDPRPSRTAAPPPHDRPPDVPGAGSTLGGLTIAAPESRLLGDLWQAARLEIVNRAQERVASQERGTLIAFMHKLRGEPCVRTVLPPTPPDPAGRIRRSVALAREAMRDPVVETERHRRVRNLLANDPLVASDREYFEEYPTPLLRRTPRSRKSAQIGRSKDHRDSELGQGPRRRRPGSAGSRGATARARTLPPEQFERLRDLRGDGDQADPSERMAALIAVHVADGTAQALKDLHILTLLQAASGDEGLAGKNLSRRVAAHLLAGRGVRISHTGVQKLFARVRERARKTI